MSNSKRGFAPLLVILIVVLVGGGSYFAVKKSRSNTNVKVETDTNADVKVGGSETKGTLRSLFALNKDTVCTFSQTTTGVTSSGTVYISGTSMRGDFSSNTSAAGVIESHMIRRGDEMYVWSKGQGTKLTMSAMMDSKPDANNQATNLDQQLAYKCVDWKKDEGKFSVPSDLKFVDIGAMMPKQPNTKVNVDAVMKAKTGQY